MPIYEFVCEDCGYEEDLMRKISEPSQTLCPKCGSQNFMKQLSAANFKLKGSGWYETDFKNKKNSSGIKKDKSKTKETKTSTEKQNV